MRRLRVCLDRQEKEHLELGRWRNKVGIFLVREGEVLERLSGFTSLLQSFEDLGWQ